MTLSSTNNHVPAASIAQQSGIIEQNDDDMWSTGIAAAIVTGTASRYHKSLFLFPHGRRILLPILVGALATALSVATLFSCRFMTILPVVGNIDHDSDDGMGGAGEGDYEHNPYRDVFQVGPWRYLSVNPSYSDGEVCLPYPSGMTLDAYFVTARSTSALASCFGCALVLWTCTLMCVPVRNVSVNVLGLCFVLNGVVQCLTATFYRSENCNGGSGSRGNDGDGDGSNGGGGGYFGRGECRPNQDLVFCMAAAVLYLATGWILYISQRFASSGSDSNAGSPSSPSSYEESMEVFTWSSEAKSSNPEKGVLRTVEKCWTKIPNGSTLTATVFVEQRKDDGCGKTKTTYSIQTEILPA
mmetsp:Transcript_759/g.1292  ORF Transcript_759/g.1292 Transcript_759/m.1292 type:complete len:356 (-) Transcript_759:55-1122(-)